MEEMILNPSKHIKSKVNYINYFFDLDDSKDDGLSKCEGLGTDVDDKPDVINEILDTLVEWRLLSQKKDVHLTFLL